MSITPKELFASLQAGDLLMIPIVLPDSRQEIMAFAAVLRREGDQLYLSKRWEQHASDQADACCNPFHWDNRLGVLVNKEGKMPLWYSVDIQVERGGAPKLAEQYAQVPRVEQCRYEISDHDAMAFLKNSAEVNVLRGIVQNGEAGSPATQLALALDVMGVSYTKEQLVGLGYFAESMVARSRVNSALLIAISEGMAGDVPMGE